MQSKLVKDVLAVVTCIVCYTHALGDTGAQLFCLFLFTDCFHLSLAEMAWDKQSFCYQFVDNEYYKLEQFHAISRNSIARHGLSNT